MKPEGEPCKCQALPDSEFCLFHDPDRREELLEAARKGGSRRTIELPEGELLTAEKARRILSGTVQAMLEGLIPDTAARAVGYLLQIDNRIREGHDVEKRLEVLEELIAKEGRKRKCR